MAVTQAWIDALERQVEKEKAQEPTRQKLKRVGKERLTWVPPASTRLRDALASLRQGEDPTKVARELEQEAAAAREQRKKAGWEAKKLGVMQMDLEKRLDLLEETIFEGRKRLQRWIDEKDTKEKDVALLEKERDLYADWATWTGRREEELKEIAKKIREGPRLERVEEVERERKAEKPPSTLDRWMPAAILIPIGLMALAYTQRRG